MSTPVIHKTFSGRLWLDKPPIAKNTRYYRCVFLFSRPATIQTDPSQVFDHCIFCGPCEKSHYNQSEN